MPRAPVVAGKKGRKTERELELREYYSCVPPYGAYCILFVNDTTSVLTQLLKGQHAFSSWLRILLLKYFYAGTEQNTHNNKIFACKIIFQLQNFLNIKMVVWYYEKHFFSMFSFKI